jgi:hypothetical protein
MGAMQAYHVKTGIFRSKRRVSKLADDLEDFSSGIAATLPPNGGLISTGPHAGFSVPVYMRAWMPEKHSSKTATAP